MYLCSAVLQPFQELGIGFDFCRISNRLEVDWDDATRKLNSGLYSGFLFIRYFGSSVHTAPPTGFFDQWPDVTVIEDLAQALLTPGVGCLADYTVYSLRKWIGLPDGGAVIASSRSEVPAVLNSNFDFVVERLSAFELRRLYREGALRSKEPYLNRFKNAERILDENRGGALGISALSVRILRTTDYRVVAAARRRNFMFLMTHFPTARGLTPLPMAWGKRDVPIGFPIVCSQRDWLRSELKDKGIYCPIHWKLPKSIQSWPDARPAMALSRSILTLPCDQRYTEGDMEFIISCLQKLTKTPPTGKQKV
jgi:hypothetical protein